LLFYLIFFEPMMLSSFGTTPGKALLGIKIRRALSGKKISYTTGMKRGSLLWLNGMGMGIPFIAFFTMIFAYSKLKRNGITSWDERCGISVIHDRLSIFRVILFITIFIFCSSIWVGFMSNFFLLPQEKRINTFTSFLPLKAKGLKQNISSPLKGKD